MKKTPETPYYGVATKRKHLSERYFQTKEQAMKYFHNCIKDFQPEFVFVFVYENYDQRLIAKYENGKIETM